MGRHTHVPAVTCLQVRMRLLRRYKLGYIYYFYCNEMRECGVDATTIGSTAGSRSSVATVQYHTLYLAVVGVWGCCRGKTTAVYCRRSRVNKQIVLPADTTRLDYLHYKPNTISWCMVLLLQHAARALLSILPHLQKKASTQQPREAHFYAHCTLRPAHTR